jgi:hypothetical protein
MSGAICPRCGSARHRGRCKGGGVKGSNPKPTTAKPAPPPNPPPVTIAAALEVPPGLGFRASIEDSTLQLEQDRADENGDVYTHTISLSAVEAAKIVDWIAAQVQAA